MLKILMRVENYCKVQYSYFVLPEFRQLTTLRKCPKLLHFILKIYVSLY